MAIANAETHDAPESYAHPEALRYYADAALRRVDAATHLGLIPGAAHLPLTGIRLRRHVQTAADPAKRGALRPVGEQAPATAAEIFALREDCVILAGPGAGKSTLLRAVLTDALDAEVPTGPAVPVLLDAVDLAAALTAGASDASADAGDGGDAASGSAAFAAAVAAAVRARLAAYTDPDAAAQWDAEFFATAPLPGARWHILIDAVNEITDKGARDNVLRHVTAAAREHPLLYRFILTTRPLPDDELPQSPEWHASRHDLLEPSDAGRETIATRWLTALGAPDAVAHAREIAARHRGEPVTPLAVALACLLHTHPDTATPPDAPTATAVSTAPASRFELYTAAARILASHNSVADQPPHPTFAEYRAAIETAADPTASATAYAAMFGPSRERTWSPTDRDWSPRSFLLAAWAARPDMAQRVTAGLRELAARRTLAACQFIAALATDGVPLDPAVVREATAGLLALTAKRSVARRAERRLELTTRSHAVYALGLLGDERAAELARALIEEAGESASRTFLASTLLTAYSPDTVRAEIIKDMLGRFVSGALEDLSHAVEIPEQRGPGADGESAVPAAPIAPPVESEEFEDLWQLRTGDLFGPLSALMRRGSRGEPVGRDVRADDLARRAADPGTVRSSRLSAIEELARRGDPRTADLFDALYRTPGATRSERRRCLVGLASLGDARAADLVTAAVGEHPLGATGLSVAQAFVKAHSPLGMELLWTIASNPEDTSQWDAAGEMAKQGDLRGQEVVRNDPIRLPPHPHPTTARAWTGAIVRGFFSACGLAYPYAGAFLLGLAYAGSGGSRPGPVNWIAFVFTTAILLNLVMSGALAYTLANVYVRRRYPRYLNVTLGLRAVALATPLVIIAFAVDRLLPAGFHTLGRALWDLLILRF
ncbi:hypothetical protein KDL01_35505 [Actinospica durhamensis]|uniref:NACHT domain-containing protein n=1 Tax=Actinospica durhamensis TaxID=1508375 RepID=A0A941F010_9ACTN|nr:hypothetical protein [Actinospica durhamensis]MBR7838629.1 hypothetical protein [Actinospica durhamensis]